MVQAAARRRRQSAAPPLVVIGVSPYNVRQPRVAEPNCGWATARQISRPVLRGLRPRIGRPRAVRAKRGRPAARRAAARASSSRSSSSTSGPSEPAGPAGGRHAHDLAALAHGPQETGLATVGRPLVARTAGGPS